MVLSAIIAILVILAFAYKQELRSWFNKIKNVFSSIELSKDFKDWCSVVLAIVILVICIAGAIDFLGDETTTVVKRTEVTVVSVKQDDGSTYIKLSDGYVVSIEKGYKPYAEWSMTDKGDKVSKLIHENGKVTYTPVLEDEITN